MKLLTIFRIIKNIPKTSWRSKKQLNIKPKTVNSRLVVVFPLFILLHFYIIPNVDYANNHQWQISIVINKPGIWAFLPGVVIGLLTFFVDGFLIVYFLGRKGFCRFICFCYHLCDMFIKPIHSSQS